MSIEPGVVDANVLVYALNSDSPQYLASRKLLQATVDPAVKLYVTSQIICEFYSLITNPKRVPAALASGAAVQVIRNLLNPPGLRMLAAPVQAMSGLLQLLERRPITGGDVFDLQIVATMQANNIHRIYTFNVGDFQVFPELSVVRP